MPQITVITGTSFRDMGISNSSGGLLVFARWKQRGLTGSRVDPMLLGHYPPGNFLTRAPARLEALGGISERLTRDQTVFIRNWSDQWRSLLTCQDHSVISRYGEGRLAATPIHTSCRLETVMVVVVYEVQQKIASLLISTLEIIIFSGPIRSMLKF